MVGQAIRKARLAAGLTQASLAERAELQEQSISRLERGAFEPSLSSLLAIAAALGVGLDDLVQPREAVATPPAQGRSDIDALAREAQRLPISSVRLLLNVAKQMNGRAELSEESPTRESLG